MDNGLSTAKLANGKLSTMAIEFPRFKALAMANFATELESFHRPRGCNNVLAASPADWTVTASPHSAIDPLTSVLRCEVQNSGKSDYGRRLEGTCAHCQKAP